VIKDYTFLKHKTKNLVYVPTLKAASTYFRTHLLANEFVPVNQEHIRFADNHLFSHIMEPIKRRNKGVTEFFHGKLPLPDKQLLQGAKVYDALLQILQAPYFDEHSAPLHLLFHGFINQIYFIPIDVKELEYLEITSVFLRQHGIVIDFPPKKIHQSGISQIEIFHVVEKHLESSMQHSNLVEATFAQDIALYQRVLESFNIYTP